MELGNLFIEAGHEFTVYSPQGEYPTWFHFKGKVKTVEHLKDDELDAIFFTELDLLQYAEISRAHRKIFYHVSRDKQTKSLLHLEGYEKIACSTNVFLADTARGISSFKAVGGIDVSRFSPKCDYHIPADRPVNILAYGRLGMRTKGTKYIVRACEKLYRQGYNIKLLLFDTPVTDVGRQRIADFSTSVPYEFILNHPVERNNEIFERADIFVAAEGKAGWSNTVAEAMAAGIPVIATKAGTLDILTDGVTGLRCKRNSHSITHLLRQMIADEPLRSRLGEAGRKRIENFDWHQLASRLLDYLEHPYEPMRLPKPSFTQRICRLFR